MWETLEELVREKAREFIQDILEEEEVMELSGRGKSERRAAVDAPPGYRNGYGESGRLAMSRERWGCAGRGCAASRSASRAGCRRCSRGGRRRWGK